jgi:glycosyltransferase involved in cell wall biosynthesis
MKTADAMDFVCFGGEDWWYHNRGHTDMQLMRRFARMGTTLYVNSIVMGKPTIGDGKKFREKVVRKAKSIFKGLEPSGVGFWVYSPFTLPVHHIPWVRPFNQAVLQLQIQRVTRKLRMSNPVVWVVCPVACDTALNIKRSKLVYQRTDRFEDYPNVDVETIAAYDRKLKAEADLTIFVNTSLYDEEAGQCRNAIYLDHGVDFEMFTSAEGNPQRPADIAPIQGPIAGYFGALDGHKLDVGFIEAVADLSPGISFVFVGNVSHELLRLAEKENVWLLGQKPYEQIPDYGKCFDVAILPWARSRWTQAANPIKLKEYLALGKPVVSTSAFSEVQQYRDVVHVADTPEEFSRKIVEAMAQNGPDQVAARRKRVEHASWDGKARMVLAAVFGNESLV